MLLNSALSELNILQLFASSLLKNFSWFSEEESSAGKHENSRVRDMLEGKILFGAISPFCL